MLIEFILPAGTTVHRNGIPVTLKTEVRCEAHVANIGMIFGNSNFTQGPTLQQQVTALHAQGWNLGDQPTTNGSGVMCRGVGISE